MSVMLCSSKISWEAVAAARRCCASWNNYLVVHAIMAEKMHAGRSGPATRESQTPYEGIRPKIVRHSDNLDTQIQLILIVGGYQK